MEATTDVAGTVVIDSRRQGALAPSICMVFDVESCRYCVPPGATLKVSVALAVLIEPPECNQSRLSTILEPVAVSIGFVDFFCACTDTCGAVQSIARHYLLNIDWLRLYNSNPGVANPDWLLPQQPIQVGPLYSVASGDTLLSIAGMCE